MPPFCPLDDPRNVGLMRGVVAGIAHYGNLRWRNPPWAEKLASIPATAATPW